MAEKANLPPLVRAALDYAGPAIYRVTSKMYGPRTAETLLEQVCQAVLDAERTIPAKYQAESTRVNYLVVIATVKAGQLHKLLADATPGH